MSSGSNTELKTCTCTLTSEGLLGFYVYNKDKDKLLAALKDRVSELNNSMISKSSRKDGGCFKVGTDDNEIMGYLESGHIPIWLHASILHNSIQSWSELFCGRAEQKLHSRKLGSTCSNNRSECCDRRSGSRNRLRSSKHKHCRSKTKPDSVFDSCRYHGCDPDCYFGSVACINPCYGYPPSFCCYQCPFISMYSDYPFIGSEWSYGDCWSNCERCCPSCYY